MNKNNKLVYMEIDKKGNVLRFEQKEFNSLYNARGAKWEYNDRIADNRFDDIQRLLFIQKTDGTFDKEEL